METTQEDFDRGIPSVPNQHIHASQFAFGAASVTFQRKKHIRRLEVETLRQNQLGRSFNRKSTAHCKSQNEELLN